MSALSKYALRFANGDHALADDFVQEANIAWWERGEVARLEAGELRWKYRFIFNQARTYWRVAREAERRLQLLGPVLVVDPTDPVYLVPLKPARYTGRAGRPRGVANHTVLRGDEFKNYLNAQVRARRQAKRDVA